MVGSAPTGARDVALAGDMADAAGVRPGADVTVLAAGQRGTYRVTAVLPAAEGVLYFSDSTARRLAGRDRGPRAGTVDLIAVRTEPGAEEQVAARIRALAGGAVMVSTGAARGDAEVPEAVAARGILPVLAGSLAGVTLLVVGFIVAGALAVSIAAQRRDLALMRAVGATPRQVRRLAAAQAVLVTALVLAPGVAAGYLLAERFRLALVSAGMLPAVLPLTVSPLPAVAAALLLLLVVSVAARCASWRTSRRPATEAVAESRAEPRVPSRRRSFAGLLVLVAALVLGAAPLLVRSAAGAAVTALSGILATIGLGLLGPALVRRTGAALARRLSERTSAGTWLAVANSNGYAQRVAGAVTTLAMAVALTLTYTFTQTTLLRATDADIDAAARAQLTLTAPALGGLPAAVPADLQKLPGVRAAAPVSTTTVVWPYQLLGETEVETAPALILDPAAPGVLDLDLRSGSLAALTGASIAVDAEVARSRGATPGSAVDLILGDGARVTAKVVATYARGLGFGPVVLSRDLVAGHTTTGLDQRILIRTDGSAAAGRAVTDFAAARPGLTVTPNEAAGPGGDGGLPPELWINIVVLAVLLGYLLLGIATRLVAATLQRRTEIATLRLIGATPRQVRAMMRREAGLVGGAALVGGLMVSVVPLALLGAGFLHRPWPAGPVWLLPIVAVSVAGIAWLTVEIPTRRLLRIPPVAGLAGE